MTWGLAAFILVVFFSADWFYDWHKAKKRAKEWQDLNEMAHSWNRVDRK